MTHAVQGQRSKLYISVLVLLFVFIVSSFTLAATEPTTITVSVWSNNPNPSIYADVERFHALYPDINVEVYVSPNADYVDKILALIASGSAPDVIKIDGYFFPRFAAADALLPLEPYAEKDKEFMDGFFPHTFMPDHQIYNGVLYGIPNGDSARGMFYNIDMFQQAGIELPADQANAGRWDWDAYVDAVRKLTRSVDGNVTQWGTQVSGDIRVLINWIKMNGGSLLNDDKTAATITSQETLEAVEFQRALYLEYGAAKPGLGTAQFAGGELATMINGIWAAGSLDNVPFNWDAGPLPAGKEGLWSVYKPNSFTIFRDTKHPDEAWELVKFLTGDETEALALPDGGYEVKRRANALYLLDVHPIPNSRYFLDMIADGRVFSLPVIPQWNQLEELFNREWRGIRDGKQSPVAGMTRAKEAIDGMLQAGN